MSSPATHPYPVYLPRQEQEFGDTPVHRSFLALADFRCSYCFGRGMRGKRNCECVMRRIFRACLAHYRYIHSFQDSISSCVATISRHGGATKLYYSRKSEEFCADFCVIAKRALTPKQWRIFQMRYLDGGDWKHCCQALGMDRGNYFHAVYRIEVTLGRAYSRTEPYALYPIDEYMASQRGCDLTPKPQAIRKSLADVVPLRKVAA